MQRFPDIFIARFSSTGQLIWGTYYGDDGNFYDQGRSIAVRPLDGSVYVAGNTTSVNNIASPGAYSTSGQGVSNNIFLARFNSSGQRLWGTYFGIGGAPSIAVSNNDGSVYLTGTTTTGISATPGAWQTSFSPTFLAKFNLNGQYLWGTYYGGNNTVGNSVAVSPIDGSVFISGYTSNSAGIASPGAHQIGIAAGTDAFLAKFNSSGQRIWGTYYGGTGNEVDCYVAVNPTPSSASVYLAGSTNSVSGIATPGVHKTNPSGSDTFIVKFAELFVNLSSVPSCAMVGQTINVNVPTQTSSGCLPVTLTASSLPPGLTFYSTPNLGTITGTLTTAGVFTFTITGTDNCNLSIPYFTEIKVGNTITTLPNSYPVQYGIVGQNFSFNANGSVDPNFGPPVYTITPALATGLTLNNSTGIISGTPTVVGTTTHTITVADTCGNTISSPLTIQIVPSQPCSAVNLSATASALNCNTIQLSWTASGSCNSSHFLAIRHRIGSNPWVDISPSLRPVVTAGTYSITGLSGNTTYQVQIQVVSPQANTPDPAAWITIANVTTPSCTPVITGPATATLCEGSSGTVSLTATNSPTSYAHTGGTLPSGMTFNTTTGQLTGTPGNAGTFSLTFTATNANGTSSPFTMSLTVNPLPTITSAGTVSATVNQSFSYTLTGTGTLSISAISAAPGLSISGTTLSGTPTAGGTYSYLLSATNGCGTVSNTLTVVVTQQIHFLMSARLRAVHNSSPVYNGDVPLTLAGTVTSVDPRAHTLPRELVLTFAGSGNITSITVVPQIGTMTLGTPIYSGNVVRIPVTGMANNAKYEAKITSVNGVAPSGPDLLRWRLIRGDFDGNGKVTNVDVQNVVLRVGQTPLTVSNFRADIDGGGTITTADVTQAQNNLGANVSP